MTVVETKPRVFIVQPEVVCTTCWGDGEEREYDVCDLCGGDGVDEEDECPECDGSGEVLVVDECPGCSGDGQDPQPAHSEDVLSLLSNMMQTIADRGIGVTVPDGEPGRCCGGCITADAQRGVRGGWIGFHEQSLKTAIEHGSLYLNHDLPDSSDAEFVYDTLSSYGTVKWDGTHARAIVFRLPDSDNS